MLEEALSRFLENRMRVSNALDCYWGVLSQESRSKEKHKGLLFSHYCGQEYCNLPLPLSGCQIINKIRKILADSLAFKLYARLYCF